MRSGNRWHLMSAEETLDQLRVDQSVGLSTKEASARLRRNGNNNIWKIKRASVWGYALEVLSDMATVLLIVTAILAAVFKYHSEAIAICIIILLGGALRVFTYIRAQRIFEDMSRRVIPRTRVVRDGKVYMISSENVVAGDILLLGPGDTVPCDARIISASDLAVAENKITENDAPVHKNESVLNASSHNGFIAVESRSNMLFAATTVVSGNCRAVATSTGSRTYVAARHGGLIIPSGEEIPLISKLSVWCKYASLVMLAAVIVITFAALLGGDGTNSAVTVFLSVMSLAVASMSEYFCAIGCIVIANSMRDASDKAAIKDAASVEKIASVDCIVIPSVSMLKSGRAEIAGYCVGDRLNRGVRGFSSNLDMLLSYTYASTGALPGALGGYYGKTDSYVDAVRRICEENKGSALGTGARAIKAYRRACEENSGGVDTVLLACDDGIDAVCAGDYSRVLSMCTELWSEGGSRPLTDLIRKKIIAECSAYEAETATVIAIAKRKSPFNNFSRIRAIQSDMTFVGFIAVSEPLIDGIEEKIRSCREAGYSFLLFSEGSHVEKAIAEKCGIITNRDRILSPKECTDIYTFSLDSGECAMALLPLGDAGVTAAGRMIECLEKDGRRCAFIGNGISDVAPMTNASVAMAAISKTSMARVPILLLSRSDVLLYTENSAGGFDCALHAVRYARGALVKIRKTVSYMLTSQIARLVIMISGAFFHTPLVNSIQLLILGLVVDFLAVLCISYAKPGAKETVASEEEMGLYGFDRKVLLPVVMGLLWGVVTISAPYVCDVIMNTDSSLGAPVAMFASSVICSVVAACENGAISSRKERSSMHTAVFCVFAAVALGLLLLAWLYSPFAMLIGGTTLTAATALAAVFAPVLLLATYELCKKMK